MNSSPTPGAAGKTDKPERGVDERPRSVMALWLQHHYAVITASFGGLLLVMAIVAPIISPDNQRGEIVIMTILFGFIGALMLYKAVAPGRRPSVTEDTLLRYSDQSSAAVKVGISSAAILSLRAHQARRARTRAWIGAAFGLLFALAGLVAPFALSEGVTSADARFVMMIGFAPVVISGALMVWVFGKLLLPRKRRLSDVPIQASAGPTGEIKNESILSTLSNVGISSGILMVVCAAVLPFIVSDVARPGMITTAVLMVGIGIGLSLLGVGIRRGENWSAPAGARPVARRAPVARVPGGVLYRIVVPAAIGLAVLLIVAVIVVVIFATAVPLAH